MAWIEFAPNRWCVAKMFGEFERTVYCGSLGADGAESLMGCHGEKAVGAPELGDAGGEAGG